MDSFINFVSAETGCSKNSNEPFPRKHGRCGDWLALNTSVVSILS